MIYLGNGIWSDSGPDTLSHGGQWKTHKYIAIRNGRYIYPDDSDSGFKQRGKPKTNPNRGNKTKDADRWGDNGKVRIDKLRVTTPDYAYTTKTVNETQEVGPKNFTSASGRTNYVNRLKQQSKMDNQYLNKKFKEEQTKKKAIKSGINVITKAKNKKTYDDSVERYKETIKKRKRIHESNKPHNWNR